MLEQWLFPPVLRQSLRKWGILYWIPFFANHVLYLGIQSLTVIGKANEKGGHQEVGKYNTVGYTLLEDFPNWK